ncbi:hypothetical protein DFH08DRAFT_951805 [Mycena albidolilacea]|uniref:DUF6534 domain-containing protein n=1 Tax=Mycena albidolilacea TaxID=1033008 RepID=A0AAD7AK91_9AGAR|nr:hypothetical protein DFH08DRAFT_951805 [Mycena albidolilacea]
MAEVEGLDRVTLTLGAFIIGGFISVALSAVVGFQTFLYFQIFPMDTLPYKFLVAWIWLIDTGHTASVCATIWQYAVLNFNNPTILLAILLEIVSAFPVAIAFTLISTLNANLHVEDTQDEQVQLVAHRTYRNTVYSEDRHVQIYRYQSALANPSQIAGLGFFAGVETALSKHWGALAANHKGWVVAGMAVSAATDIVISAARYYYLRDLKQGYMATPEMVDAVVIFTINDGILTCATLIASIACFVGMPKNFIWLGLYIPVAKLFSNSILTTLNLRNWSRHRHRPMGISLTRPQANRNTLQISTTSTKIQSSDGMPAAMEVFMDQQVEYNTPAQKYRNENHDTRSQP